MQFTELSELNHVVGLMRLAACNSPTFHDRQDSEVDRIYNSSPKMELQLRNSWLDKMTAFNPQASSAASGSGTASLSGKKAPKCLRKGSTSGGFVVSNGGKAGDETTRDGREKCVAGSGSAAQSLRRRPSTQSGRGDKKVVVGSAAAAAAGAGGQSEIKEETETAVAAEEAKDGDDGFTFEREEVLPMSFHELSLLDKALKGPAASTLGARPPMMGADGSAVLHLTIYLPTRDEMKIDLYDVSTVDEAIQELLRVHQANARQPTLYYGHPECYELRLHDSDGIPDEDFPALDRSRKIKNFGDAGGHEYCLCERPDACPPTSDATPDTASPAAVAKPSAAAAKTPSANDKAFLKIFMPKSDDYTVVAIDGTTVGQDLLPTLNKKHRLQLFQELYVLKISEVDRDRLDLASDEIDMHTKLRPLNLHEVTLATKIFADAPQISAPAPSSMEETTNLDSRSRPPPETFMFNDVTAAMFKEWHIIKKNKYGKKQQRMLGIDLNKIYNRKVGERVITSSKSTKIAERPMSGVVWVRFNQDPSEFQIYFKDSIEEIITDYTADSPYECAEIVAKLKYILSRRK